MFIGVMILVSTLGGGVARAADHLNNKAQGGPGKESEYFYVMPSKELRQKCMQAGNQVMTYTRTRLGAEHHLPGDLQERVTNNMVSLCYHWNLPCKSGEHMDQDAAYYEIPPPAYADVCYVKWTSFEQELEDEQGLGSGEITLGDGTVTTEGGYTVTIEDSGVQPSYCELNPNATSCQCERGGGVWTPTSLIKNTEEGLCSTAEGGINDTLQIVISIMTVLIGLLAAIGIVVVGVQYLSARDNPDRLTKAKQRFLNMGVGLAIYAMMAAIVGFLMPGGYQFVPSEVVMEEVDEEEEPSEEEPEEEVVEQCGNTYNPNKTYTSPYDGYAGSAGPMYGNIVVVSIFVDDGATSWGSTLSSEETQIHTQLGRAVTYLWRQSERWGHNACFYWDWMANNESDLKYVVGKKFNGAISSRSDTTSAKEYESVALSIIDKNKLVNKYHADSILAIYFVNTMTAMDDSVASNHTNQAWLVPEEKGYFETVIISVHNNEYGMVYPSIIAHEMSHAFGAVDLYTNDARTEPADPRTALSFAKMCNAGYVVDIMCNEGAGRMMVSELGENRYFSEIDAYFTGLTNSSPRINYYNEVFKPTAGLEAWGSSDHVMVNGDSFIQYPEGH